MTKIVLRPNETAQAGYRRLQKILDKSGQKQDLRDRERYEKPSAKKRRAKVRVQRRDRG